MSTASTKRFFVPQTLQSDFDAFLENDIPGAVEEFELVRDWYQRGTDGYETVTIRGEIYPDTTKSRYENTDNNLNFRTSLSADIRKGDMIIDPRGTIYVFDWDIPPQPNNKMTRALRCNLKTTFYRWHTEEVDENGYLIAEGGDKVIAAEIPCNGYRMDGRLEFTTNAEKPGLIANTVTNMTVQYNEQTKNLRVDDTFAWQDAIYIISDIDYVGVNMDSTHGVLMIQAKKKAGGSL